jgi:hypothetical protein
MFQDRAIVQLVIGWPLTADGRVQNQANVGSLVNKIVPDMFSSQYFRFPPSIFVFPFGIILSVLHTHSTNLQLRLHKQKRR